MSTSYAVEAIRRCTDGTTGWVRIATLDALPAAVALCDRQRLTCRIVLDGVTLYTNR